ncbi:hypothetical protein DQ384_17500 [Sphaerisporangium album]|uniref:Tissue inhibitor of metalloproteinase n=1 Tax=Sphaerisporangium album TaxID=509200 RepID=A0A367FJR6_9ACTN|nr:hypothetical protein [Sphaerisporangium album]RCG29957.1 hypothetical protein DQ384_17500 [Sphaerisporangium album]
MRSRVTAVVLLAAGFLVTAPNAACACSCAPQPPADQMKRSAAVFTGTVVASRQAEGGDPLGVAPPIVYTFRADQVYKGDPVVRFEVASNADTPACGYQFTTGGRYLVFASSERTGLVPPVPGVPLHTSQCAGNRQVSGGTAPLRAGVPATSGDPVDAALITALGTPKRPSDAPPADSATPQASPVASGDGDGDRPIQIWYAAGGLAAGLVLFAGLRLLGRRLNRRRPDAG